MSATPPYPALRAREGIARPRRGTERGCGGDEAALESGSGRGVPQRDPTPLHHPPPLCLVRSCQRFHIREGRWKEGRANERWALGVAEPIAEREGRGEHH